MFDVRSMNVPLLVIIPDGGGFAAEPSYESFITCHQEAAANYEGVVLIESSGRAVRLAKAQIAPGSYAPWWRFWNRSVRADLQADGAPFQMTLDKGLIKSKKLSLKTNV